MVSLGQAFQKLVVTVYFLGYTFLGTIILVAIFRLQIDWPLLYTLWVAEVPIAVFLRYILGEGTQDRPNLIIQRKKPTKLIDAAKMSGMYGARVKNAGQRIAESCQARITLRDVTAEDLADRLGLETLINKLNFQSIENITIPCQSEIRPDDTATLEFVRTVRNSHDLRLLRLELPSEKGWGPILCALKPRNYKGTVKVGASIGKPATARIIMKYNQKKDEMRFSVSPMGLSL